MKIAAPAVLVRPRVTVAGRHQPPGRGDWKFEQRRSQYVAGFTPIEARVRDDNFESADQQSKEAQSSDPVSDADEGRMPCHNRRGWDGRGSSWNASRIAHAGMVPRGAYVRHPRIFPPCALE